MNYETPRYDQPGPQNKEFGRFMRHILIAGAISGVLSGIPLLNCLNCLFCLLNMAGIIIGLNLYLKAFPEDKVSMGEAAGFGAVGGALAGFISSILGMLTSAMVAQALTGFMSRFNPQVAKQMAMNTGAGIVGIFINVPLFAAFGALGGILGMALFFKDRRAA